MASKTNKNRIQEPHRHHYIPQFILRRFNDENGQVNYWNIENSKLEKRNVKSIFMGIDMYRDEKQHADDPTIIESNFSKFEQEIAELISTKIIDKKEIVLTRRENEKLRIFITLMAFRSNNRMKQYKENNFDESTRSILLQYQHDGNFEELWKRELDVLANCRTYKEVEDSEVIDPIIKMDFSNGITSFFMTFIETISGEFLLTDIYPTLEIFPLIDANIHLHLFVPLSPTRMLLLNHIMFKSGNRCKGTPMEIMYKVSKIKGDLIIPPIPKYKLPGTLDMDDEYRYKVRDILASDTEYINALFLNEARVGVIFRDKDEIYDSIESFNKRINTKQSFEKLEEELQNN